MGKIPVFRLLLLLLTSVTSFSQSSKLPMFSLLDEKQTGISFSNIIKEDDSLNVMRYEYLYNGAGVGVGDFNNDGLIDIFFSSNTGSNKLFLNLGNFKFKDITKEAGVAGNGTWSTGVSIADVNGDGLMDIYVCHSGKYDDPLKLSNDLFINQGIQGGIPVFKNMAAAFGLDAPGTQSTQAVFFDYDKDGDLDMFLLNHSNHTYNPFLNTRNIRATPNFSFGNRLFRNDRDNKGNMHFTDVTLQAGIINNALNFGLSVTVSDVNNDGWPDIYTTSDYTERDCLYINNHDGSFRETLTHSFAHISKYSMGADIADFNNDGRTDLVTLDMLPEDNHRQKLLKGPDEYDQYHLLLDSGYYHQQMRNMLQLNQGEDQNGFTRFSEIGQLAGVSNTDWSWSALLADFDNDGWKDLFISNGYLRDFTNLDFLKYTVPDAKVKAAKEGHQNFKTYDLVKQMPSNKLSNYIFHNNHALGFVNATVDWNLQTPSVSNAAAYADLDNDGDLDLIVCSNNEPARVYRNNESDILKNHFVKFRLYGTGMNSRAYGARITLKLADGNKQLQELFPVRGYQSTVSQDLQFGFSKNTYPISATINWPDGKESVLDTVSSDQLIIVKESETRLQVEPDLPSPVKKIFKDITRESGIDFVHHENDFIDFKEEVLLPYQLSRQGPALARADVNNDGLEDIYIGGAIGQAGILYLQTKDGKFVVADNQPWKVDTTSEQVNAIFFDVNGDGKPDLYVVSGGNEYGDGSPEYADQLYINDGKGNFSKALNSLPPMLSSKYAIAAGDFDHDGDLDLFIGGRGVPGSFPLPSRSYILRNDTKNGQVLFTDVTEDVCPALKLPGMVTAASWVDKSTIGFPDLIIAGDWMPVIYFKNSNGHLEDATKDVNLSHLNGMWSAIFPLEKKPGSDNTFVLGNCGWNNQFKASENQPMTMYAADFDDNGTIDPVVCYYIQGKSYPMASRDEMLDQINGLKRKYITYKDYADATINDLFPKNKIDKAKIFTCDQLASGILTRDNQGHFLFKALPTEAQFSRVSGVIVDDFDHDGISDILVSGNFYPYRTQLGACDASLGLLLKGTSDGYIPMDAAASGCYIDGDARNMVEVTNSKGEKIIVISKNNAAVQVLKVIPK